ncbi:MAG TPA: hypothetical protein VGR40_07615, partial [Candidatus Binatus sp.]|nr:hypothetical protein [Candidatus Binatus sp.]
LGGDPYLKIAANIARSVKFKLTTSQCEVLCKPLQMSGTRLQIAHRSENFTFVSASKRGFVAGIEAPDLENAPAGSRTRT